MPTKKKLLKRVENVNSIYISLNTQKYVNVDGARLAAAYKYFSLLCCVHFSIHET